MDFKKLECAHCFKVGASYLASCMHACKHVYVCTYIYCMLILHIALAFLSLGVGFFFFLPWHMNMRFTCVNFTIHKCKIYTCES